MLNRRLIRIKVFKVLFGRISSGSDSLAAAREELLKSCGQTRDLYFFILGSTLALRKLAEERIEAGLSKYYPTEEERNPNRKFVDMKFFTMLEESADYHKICRNSGFMWGEDERGVAKELYRSMVDSDYYREFMASDDMSLKAETDFLRKLFMTEYENNGALENMLEDMSMFWVEDLGFVLMNIIRDLQTVAAENRLVIPSVFAGDGASAEDSGYTETDREFALKLLEETMLRYGSVISEITSSVGNWDRDRLVFTDLLLVAMGLVEARTFPSIPVKVTINEYVDMSKFYSTENSSVFVNGVLDRMIKAGIGNGSIVKKGRGLIGQ